MICMGIHAADRRMEYGTARKLDYMQRGAKSALYNRFILEELLPIIQEKLGVLL
jgi:enterochelin esterase-like enzyme